MLEMKPAASLMPTLLARKGGAKPAMRSQLPGADGGHPGFAASGAEALEDLGWNDLGEDPQPAGAALPPAGLDNVTPIVPDQTAVDQAPAALPEVVRQLDLVARAVKAAAPPKPARKRGSALAEGRRAAFTLRLDADQHLRLRLACAVQNRSAQQLISEALERPYRRAWRYLVSKKYRGKYRKVP
jgi:hypothetical protein